MDADRKEEAAFFEELCGAQEIVDCYDLINSPQPNSSELNPKSLTLTVLVGESSERDSMFEVKKPQLVTNLIKGVASATVSEDSAKIHLSPVIN